jgi:hypothetical protein
MAKMKVLKGDKLQAAVLRMVLMRSLGVRKLRGACFMCYVVMKESDEFKGMKEQLQAYSQQKQALGKRHGLGPPSLFAFGGLLQALKGRGQTIGAITAARIQELHQAWIEAETEAGHDMVPKLQVEEVLRRDQ